MPKKKGKSQHRNQAHKDTENRKILLLFLRYITVLILALPNLFIFYYLFTPLTIYPSNFLISLFYSSHVQGNIILGDSFAIQIIEACVAGSAYYLLFLLNFSVPMSIKKRVYSLLFSCLFFLFVNILRIFIFSILLINDFKYFNVTHLIFWHILSGVIVFLVWFFEIKLFNIKETPFLTDINTIYKQIKRR
jgi:exosortase/archaeosortase family protein